MRIIIGGNIEMWGIIPGFLDEDDPRPAKEQFNARYIGGWSSFEGFKFDRYSETLTFGEGEDADPPMRPLSVMLFRTELILLFDHAWVMILQPDNTWEISRMD